MNAPKFGLYNNRWEGDTLYFTAIGRNSDQTLEEPWQNLKLSNYKEKCQKLYLFEKQKPSHYEYQAEVEMVDSPFTEKPEDEEGKNRKVYVFPIKKK